MTHDKIEDIPEYHLINDKFPHIGTRIFYLWGYPEFNIFMSQLLDDTRNGTRQGFPTNIADALLNLSHRHDIEYPQHKPKADIWGYAP